MGVVIAGAEVEQPCGGVGPVAGVSDRRCGGARVTGDGAVFVVGVGAGHCCGGVGDQQGGAEEIAVEVFGAGAVILCDGGDAGPVEVAVFTVVEQPRLGRVDVPGEVTGAGGVGAGLPGAGGVTGVGDGVAGQFDFGEGAERVVTVGGGVGTGGRGVSVTVRGVVVGGCWPCGGRVAGQLLGGVVAEGGAVSGLGEGTSRTRLEGAT